VDVQSLPVDDGHVAIVEVPPIAIPPCFSNGTVWERISGQTVPVESPLRLSELYSRGDTARSTAVQFAAGAAEELMLPGRLPGFDLARLPFAVAVSATGHPPDISSRLFSESYEEDLRRIVSNRLAPLSDQPFTPDYRIGFAQSNRWLNITDRYTPVSTHYWAVRVVRNGTAVVHFTTESEVVPPKDLAQTEVRNAWQAAGELVDARRLRPGPNRDAPGWRGRHDGSPPGEYEGISLGRTLESGPPDEEMFASVERELRRTTGEAVYEEPPEGS
jgi:hypothetical protein